MFPDAEAMKQTVRRHLYKQPYNVSDMYKETGLFSLIAKSQVFEYVTLVVIAINAVWIWIDTDFNGESVLLQAPVIFQLAEHMFCLYFSSELFIRFMSFRHKLDSCKDKWFVFDTTLVAMMVLETWVMSVVILLGVGGSSGGLKNASMLRIARLLRLTRMARLARLLRAMPELMIFIKGIIASLRSVFFTLCLLAILLYIFGIAFRQMTSNTRVGDTYFRTVPFAMYTLLIDGTFMDNLGYVARDLSSEDSPLVAIVFWVFVFLSALTVINMLIGVLCQVVISVAKMEREAMLVSFVMLKMKDILTIDANNDNKISKAEFMQILEKPDAVRALQETGVEVVSLVDSADSIFDDEEQNQGGEGKLLSFAEFMDAILELRGSNTARVKDIVDLRKHVRTISMQTNLRVQRIDEILQKCMPSETTMDDARHKADTESRDAHNVKKSDCRTKPIRHVALDPTRHVEHNELEIAST